ncbi:heterokaryon incompatibility protein-domain-containing protein [Lasiosphaeria miniovina]|uniref:Heterokaryon incompatibility protein-domain-containing protein n=1 Tax=Lasiosphaeria miniovina TaxID=1954250 RepID=A0AA40BFS0_9PEZI|nr:heterokaryon incompatibility protein-domain-containing protein [Lasiosphaeria miniovina]KAK0733118.1 heterokaryon incompatibility protein-domain-containing protein [Lasiosphaeria miniovina]
MRLLNTQTLKVDLFMGQTIPAYAALSHTWGDEEVSLQDMQSTPPRTAEGFRKVEEACRVARSDGYDYVWIDTCCIDKTSSAELSEAINSMFRWYQDADVCYAYLVDLPPETEAALGDALPTCKYFTRGWTLQELIAPQDVHFYDSTWALRGSRRALVDLISEITSIEIEVLLDADELYCVPVATKMSWASKRVTTRIEDIAYCLLGLFDINMPLLYGEGRKAFRRLQEEVMRKTNDLSLLAWVGGTPGEEIREIWARSPADLRPVQRRTRDHQQGSAHLYAAAGGERPRYERGQTSFS